MAAVTFKSEKNAIDQFVAFGRASWSIPQIELAFDCADSAVDRFLASNAAVNAAYRAALADDGGWRARLVEMALSGDADALIVAGVTLLSQRPDGEALDALANCEFRDLE